MHKRHKQKRCRPWQRFLLLSSALALIADALNSGNGMISHSSNFIC